MYVYDRMHIYTQSQQLDAPEVPKKYIVSVICYSANGRTRNLALDSARLVISGHVLSMTDNLQKEMTYLRKYKFESNTEAICLATCYKHACENWLWVWLYLLELLYTRNRHTVSSHD